MDQDITDIATLFTELEHLIDSSNDPLSAWSKNYLSKTNKNRYLNDIKLIEKYYANGKMLELGSAPYHLTYILQKKGYNAGAAEG